MKRILKVIYRLNLKTLYFNLKYLPFRQALRFPVWVSRQTYLKNASGKLQINGPLKTGMIEIGYGRIGIFDEKRSRTVWEVSGSVAFNGACSIGHGSKICVRRTGSLALGENFCITAETSIIAQLHIEFGKNCLISWDTLIMDTDLHHIKDEHGVVINAPRPVSVGDDVWIGCRCLILKGAKIPSNSVIGANSLINKALENEKSLYAGVPCKLIKENVSWER